MTQAHYHISEILQMEGCTNCINFVNTLRKTVKLYNTAGKEVHIPESVSVDLHSFLKTHCEDTNEDN